MASFWSQLNGLSIFHALKVPGVSTISQASLCECQMPAQTRISAAQRLLARESVKLGRFIVNPDDPHQDYFDPPLQSPPESIQSIQVSLTEFQHDGAGAETGASLDPIACVSHANHSQSQAGITTAESEVQQLGNSRAWFREALQHQETRNWFEEMICAGEDIYLIVGFQTVRDAQLSRKRASSREHAAKLRAPIAAALAATGLVLTFALSADPEIKTSAIETSLDGGSHTAPGEQINAVQYRKAKFKWYSSRNLDLAQLEKGSMWKMKWSFRGQESEVNDVVEPQLSEDEGD